MKTRIILLCVPLAIIAGSIIYSWVIFMGGYHRPVWQHYLAPVLFLPILYFLFIEKNLVKAHIATATYLFMGMCTLLSLQIGISRTTYYFFGLTTPPFNSYCLLLMVIYLLLNCYTLFNLYLDHKESGSKS
jgi:hypothetical protein